MGEVSAWLLSIAGVVLLSVLAELALPEGQMNKYTKVIFSFVILLVVIMPLPKLFRKDFDINEFFGTNENVLQEDYIYQINLDKLTALNKDISSDIKGLGLDNVEVSINANILEETLEIYSVFVDLCDLEYAEFAESKDITKVKLKIKEIIKNYSILKDVEVVFDE